MTMYSAHDLTETPTPALFGFDLFHLITFRLWPRALDLAVLPQWFLALEINFSRRGRVVAGRVLGRGIYGVALSKWRWGMTREEDGSLALNLGNVAVVVDPKQRKEAPQIV
ncbi:hypothetical protein SAMN04488503_2464 [Humidesulfovibrio mexicanus]|uniref:Uncharacterized protein n=1 Tax=Humidesulfovibrio mexicanus TaxID=147047 RepID=A0A239B7V9_9BACT|nr:hypothetical protein [Humidesulfovibrio mexicanus]SNS03398.1 hypothetical protein SAMN04488503_2464 [Humidesulfovibrio mexicanus]